ncbi:MAG: hypothetical protein ACXVB5_12590 [Isosphaeraceae bacterium]
MPLQNVSGKLAHLRVSDSETAQPYGPQGDTLTTQVVITLQGSDKYFGFELRPGPHLPSRLAMLATLRDAYVNDLTVGLAYNVQDGKKAGTIIRVDLERA